MVCSESNTLTLSHSKAKNTRTTDRIRVSSGTAITLGLTRGFIDAKPTTAYLLTYIESKCAANCGFCPQARTSRSREDLLSRVAWPVFATADLLDRLVAAERNGKIQRICIQALNYPKMLKDILSLIKNIKRSKIEVPISVSCQPLTGENMQALRRAGVQRIGIALDAATAEIFKRVKGNLALGPYSWNRHRNALLEAVNIFGGRMVSTHLIVGLGETEKQMVEIIQWCADNNILPALFSFTPIPGTTLETNLRPTVSRYRRVQLARHMILRRETRLRLMKFDENGRISDFGVTQTLLKTNIKSGKPFLTSGCPGCNRPYYNEQPTGPIYNFPRSPTQEEIEEILQSLQQNEL